MKASVREWIDKAEKDLLTAEREQTANPPNYDAVAFHAHQCTEKYLKARLIEANQDFPKTHDLTALLHRILASEPTWDKLQPELDALTSLGTEVRYPGTEADQEDGAEALKTARRVRDQIRKSLGIAS